MNKKPDWATAKVRLHLATCWYGYSEEEGIMLDGINLFHHWLLVISIYIHQHFVDPFCDKGFPIKVIETYVGFEGIHLDQVYYD